MTDIVISHYEYDKQVVRDRKMLGTQDKTTDLPPTTDINNKKITDFFKPGPPPKIVKKIPALMDIKMDLTVSDTDSSEFSSSDSEPDSPKPGTSKEQGCKLIKDLRPPTPCQDESPYTTFIELFSILAQKQHDLKHPDLD